VSFKVGKSAVGHVSEFSLRCSYLQSHDILCVFAELTVCVSGKCGHDAELATRTGSGPARRKTRVSNLQEGSIWINTAELSVLVIALGMVYDACMGTFALLREGDRFIINCSRRW
jgi:hypothetical protein